MEPRTLKDKASEAFAKGRFSKAAELYEAYCQADPKDHQARLRLGDAWSKAGQRRKALVAYQNAAEGFAREGFLPRAIAASKLILELDPAHQGVQQMLADLYARRGTSVRRALPLAQPESTPPAAPPPPQVALKVSASTPPPGLAPRSEPPEPAPATSAPVAEHAPAETGRRTPWVAASALLTSPPPEPVVPPVGGAPPGLRPRRTEEPGPKPPPRSAFHGLSPEDTLAPQASISVSSLTELEREADSLLHAVELAAREGMRQREGLPAEDAAAAEEEEETVFSMTATFSEDGPSLDALPDIPLFSDLPRDAFIELFERCPLRRYAQGERILEQGTRGEAFYVICEGRVRVFREEGGARRPLAVLEGGAFFGELALLSGAPRTASVESAAENTQLLEISGAILSELSGRYPQVARALKKFCRDRLLSDVMNNSPLFRPLARKERRELIERFRARDVRRGEVIIREGARTEGLYVVLSGEVEVHKQGQLLSRLKEGDLFGEISLLQKTPATATVTASRLTTILRLPREDFEQLILGQPQILALVSELTDERLRRTERLLGQAAASEPAPDEDLILF